MSDLELGRKAFKYFHDWNGRFHSNYKMSFEDFLNSYGKKRDIYLDGIGGAVRFAEMSDVAVSDSMRSMASKSGGKIPENPLDMIKYFQNEATKINWVDAFKTVSYDTASDVVGGFEKVGNSVIGTGNFFLKYLTPILLIMLAFWFYSFTKNTSSISPSFFKDMKKSISKRAKKVSKALK